MSRLALKRRRAISLISGATMAFSGSKRGSAQSLLPVGVTPTPPRERRVGVSYAMWHFNNDWLDDSPKARPWGTPLLGFYRSNDSAVIKQHAEWISNANIDFINIDWSNELHVDPFRHEGPLHKQELEEYTFKLFDVYAALKQRPKISIMLGDPHVFGRDVSVNALQDKADEVYVRFVANPRYRPLLQTYIGKPLLIVYLGVHVSPEPPAWRDDRFTVRYMTAYIWQHGLAFHRGLVSTSGYWSWEERGTPTFTIYDSHPEAMTVVASWRGKGSPGRNGGRTFLENWRVARQVGPRFVLAGTFNEWWVAEQPSPDISKDIEPSKEFGFLYLDIVKKQSALFKAGI
jgi:hypothetical protein